MARRIAASQNAKPRLGQSYGEELLENGPLLEDSLLPHVSVAFAGPTDELRGGDPDVFQGLIQQANRQFEGARERRVSNTFLIIAEMDVMGPSPGTLVGTLQRFEQSSYRHIDHVYLYGYSSPRRVGGAG